MDIITIGILIVIAGILYRLIAAWWWVRFRYDHDLQPANAEQSRRKFRKQKLIARSIQLVGVIVLVFSLFV